MIVGPPAAESGGQFQMVARPRAKPLHTFAGRASGAAEALFS